MKRIFNGSGGRKAALILSLCLIFALAVGTTLAYLKANTSPVTNTFTAAKSKITIEEKTDDGIKSEIYIKNEGTATSYVRVKLVMNWVDGNGKVVSGGNLPEVTLNEPDWFMKDGIYYYTKPVGPKDSTANLLKDPITQPNAPEGCHLEVTVLAESIQAAPSKAVTDSWGVRVDNNGYLTQPTTTP
ncbi:putative uncharacterized protein [Firmicutes bacterium CAG:103]|nr:putative uncharacterized protein [Firmicutes bacterium CAG:103]